MAPQDWLTAALAGKRTTGLSGLCDGLTMTVAAVGSKRNRVEGGIIESAVVIQLDPAHALSRGIDTAELCRHLGDDFADPCWPGGNIAG